MEKNLPANAGDTKDAGSIPRWERPPGEGSGNLLQYSCLENSMDRRAWGSTVYGVTKSQTWLSNWAHKHTHTHTHTSLKHLPLERPFRPFPQSTPLGHHRAGWAPCVYSSFPLAIYFTYVSVYMSVFVSQSVPPSLPPTVSTSPFSTSASLFLPCK